MVCEVFSRHDSNGKPARIRLSHRHVGSVAGSFALHIINVKGGNVGDRRGGAVVSVSLRPYSRVLALPGVRASVVVMLLARLPEAAMGIAMTLHVVIGLGRGYGAAGLVGGLSTAGAAVGAPFVGRLLDRYGLRWVVAVCTVASAVFWMAAPSLRYEWLLLVALPAGVLSVPSRVLAKQVLAALVPPGQRRTAYALDSMSVELTFVFAPAAVTMVATQVSTTAALIGIGVAFALTGAAIWVTNPPLRTASEPAADRTPMRTWLTPRLREALLVAAGALFVMAGMEIALLASLRTSGDLEWTGLVIAIICVASILGGLIHGGVRRSLSQLQLITLQAALTIPVALFIQPWWVLALVLVPMALACAPTVAATSETVTDAAPPHVRGEAVGLQGAASQLGIACGSPVIGVVIDHSSVPWGFIAAGGGGLAVAAVAYVHGRTSTRRQASSTPAPEPYADTGPRSPVERGRDASHQ